MNIQQVETNMDAVSPVKLSIGMMIELEGEEYIFQWYEKTVSGGGRSVKLIALSPVLSLQSQAQAEAVAKTMAASALAGEMMVKFKDELMP